MTTLVHPTERKKEYSNKKHKRARAINCAGAWHFYMGGGLGAPREAE